MALVDVRIGVTYSTREIELHLADDADREDLRKQIDKTLASDSAVLWLTDKHGRVVGVPSSKVAYVELSSEGDTPAIGFSS